MLGELAGEVWRYLDGVKLVRPSGIASVSVPRITLPDTVTCLTLLASRYCWNWLYGITSVPPLPPPPPNRPSAEITTSPATISQTEDEKFGFGAATRSPPDREIECGLSRRRQQQPAATTTISLRLGRIGFVRAKALPRQA